MTFTSRNSDIPVLPVMKIHDWFDGPYPARVRIALAECGFHGHLATHSMSI